MRRQCEQRTWEHEKCALIIHFSSIFSPLRPFFSCSFCPFTLFVVAAAKCCLWAFGHAREKKKNKNFPPTFLSRSNHVTPEAAEQTTTKSLPSLLHAVDHHAKGFWRRCGKQGHQLERKEEVLSLWTLSFDALFSRKMCARHECGKGELMMANDEKLELFSPSSLFANEYKFQLSQRVSLHGEMEGERSWREIKFMESGKVGSRCRTHLSPRKFHFYEYSSRNNSQAVFFYFLYFKQLFFIAFDPEISCCCGCWKYAITTPNS